MDDLSVLDLATQQHGDGLSLLDLFDYRCATGPARRKTAYYRDTDHDDDELYLLQGLAGLGSHQELVFLDQEALEWERFWARQEDRLSSGRSVWSTETWEDSAIDGEDEVTLGRWQRPYTVTRPNADYRSVPAPIMLPGSPDQQRIRRPSVSEFVRGPQRRGFVEDCVAARRVDDVVASNAEYDREREGRYPPREPSLRRTRRRANELSDSDISLLSLGSPLASLEDDRMRVSSPSSSSSRGSRNRQHQQQQQRRRSSTRYGRRLDGIRAPVILSVDAPLGNDTSWSDPESPRSRRSAASSPGGVFLLDEDL